MRGRIKPNSRQHSVPKESVAPYFKVSLGSRQVGWRAAYPLAPSGEICISRDPISRDPISLGGRLWALRLLPYQRGPPSHVRTPRRTARRVPTQPAGRPPLTRAHLPKRGRLCPTGAQRLEPGAVRIADRRRGVPRRTRACMPPLCRSASSRAGESGPPWRPARRPGANPSWNRASYQLALG